MTSVRTLFAEGEQDYAIRIDDLHTVDVGSIALSEVTHHTRDGLPMEVRWTPALGFLVAVDATPGGGDA